jgi:hypothetical protein
VLLYSQEGAGGRSEELNAMRGASLGSGETETFRAEKGGEDEGSPSGPPQGTPSGRLDFLVSAVRMGPRVAADGFMHRKEL